MEHLREVTTDWIKNLTGQQVTKNEYLKGRQMRRRKEELCVMNKRILKDMDMEKERKSDNLTKKWIMHERMDGWMEQELVNWKKICN